MTIWPPDGGFSERQAAGLGNYFFDSLFAEIDSLQEKAGIHRKVFGFHRLIAKRFPYAVYYSVDADVVIVRAVLDCRRDPQWLRTRLRT